jgi:hypothetical protein
MTDGRIEGEGASWKIWEEEEYRHGLRRNQGHLRRPGRSWRSEEEREKKELEEWKEEECGSLEKEVLGGSQVTLVGE